MTINPIHNEPLKGKEPARAEELSRTRKVPPADPVARPEQADRVEISQEAREQAQEAGLLEESGGPGASSSAERADRLEEIRLRIRSGSYNTPEVAEEVARRLLDSGDLFPSQPEPEGS